MLHVERRDYILGRLVADGSVKVADLAAQLEVDSSPIRRDLKSLSEQYEVELVYGGAFYKKNIKSEGLIETPSLIKRTLNREQKKRIGQKAAALVRDGDTIILNNGSTAECVLDSLREMNALNVITSSLSIAAKAAMMPFVNLYLPGGKYRQISGMFFGDFTVDIIHQLSANKIFMGAMAVSLDHGVTHPIIEEVSVLKALISISEQKYLITDSTKFGKVSVAKLADLKTFDGIITDEGLPTIYREYAEAHGIDVL